MVLLILVLDNPHHLDAVLDAWVEAGIQGVTILDSTGVHRKSGRVKSAVPLFLGMSRLTGGEEYTHHTLFSIVEDASILPAVAQKTAAIIGDLRAPHTGVMFTLPIADIWGVPKSPRDDASLSPRPYAPGE